MHYTVAPQEVTQMMVHIINDSTVQVQWGPPARLNGVLTNYTIVVSNLVNGSNFSSQVDASDAQMVTITGLSMYLVSSHYVTNTITTHSLLNAKLLNKFLLVSDPKIFLAVLLFILLTP